MPGYISHYINGKLVHGRPDHISAIHNPATGEELRKVFLAGSSEVNQAVASATTALQSWSQTPALQRARILFRFKAILEANLDKLAAIVTEEHGKTLSDAKGSCMRGLEVVEFACGIPHLLKGEFSENVGKGIDSWAIRQPLGVCAGITPFNFPVMIGLWMFPMAIACGNTFILKPSERDPSASLMLAQWMKEAGLPDGVLNVVQGDKNTVDLLLNHPGIAAISFVGSTAVAQSIYTKASATYKRVQALGGAKNHMLVMPDADLDMVVDSLIGSAYGSAGERCMAISVAVAIDKVADKLVEKLAPRVRSLKIGPGTDPDVEMGPLISGQHHQKVMSYIEGGIKEGAKLVVDGRGVKLQGYEKGYFMGGSLFDHVEPHMRLYQDEIFGPVLAVVRVPSYEQGVELINNHPYGNGTAIFTRDGDTARDFANRIKIGMVGINVPIPVPMAFHSFGGWKQSLYGDHHMHGMEGVRFYTKLKTMTGRWPTGIRQGADFSIPTLR